MATVCVTPGSRGFRELTKFEGSPSGINCVAAWLDGYDRYIFTGGEDGVAVQWDIETGKCVRKFVGHLAAIQDVCVGAGYLFTASSDYTIKKWECATQTYTPYAKDYTNYQPWQRDQDVEPPAPLSPGTPGPSQKGNQRRGDSIEVEDSGTFGGDPRTAPFDMRSPQSFQGTKGHIFTVKCLAVHNGMLYSGSLDETVREWDIDTCCCLREFEIGAMMYGMCIWGDWLFTGCVGDRSKAARMWDLQTGEEVKWFVGHTGDIYDVAVDDGGEILFTASGFPDCCIKAWDIASGNCVRTIANPNLSEQLSTTEHGHSRDIRKILAFGSRLISASDDHSVKEWNIATGRCERTFKGHTQEVRALCYFQGNVFSGSMDRTAYLLWAFPIAGYDMCTSPTSSEVDPHGRLQ